MCAAAKAEAAAREEAGNDYEGNDALSDGEGSPELPPARDAAAAPFRELPPVFFQWLDPWFVAFKLAIILGLR